MKKWKIIKGTEKDFEGAPEWVTQVNQKKGSQGRLDVFMWEENFGMIGAKYQNKENSAVWTFDENSSNNNFTVVAERVEVEETMSVNHGWLVNGKFTEDDRYAKWASQHGYEVIALEDKQNKKDILDVILETSLKVQDRTEGYVLRKLNEEVGEVGEALLALAKAEPTDEALSGEIADVIITVVDLLYVHYSEIGIPSSTVKTLIEEAVKCKTEKWIEKRGA